MDEQQFARIAKTFSSGVHRRLVLGVLAGGLAAALGGQVRRWMANANSRVSR